MKKLFMIVMALSAYLLAFSWNKSYMVKHVKFNINDLSASYSSRFPPFDIESTSDDYFQLEFEQDGYNSNQLIRLYRNEKLLFDGYLKRRDERNLIQIDNEGTISTNNLFMLRFDGYISFGSYLLLQKFTRKEDGKFDEIAIVFPRNDGSFCESEIILEGLIPVEKTLKQRKEEKRLEEIKQTQLKNYNDAKEGKIVYIPQIKRWKINNVINLVEDGDCISFAVDTLGNITYTGDSERGKILFELMEITPYVSEVNFDMIGKKLKVATSGTLVFEYVIYGQDETLNCLALYDKKNGWKVKIKGDVFKFSENTYRSLANCISRDTRFQDTSKKYEFNATGVNMKINVRFKGTNEILESVRREWLIKNLKSK